MKKSLCIALMAGLFSCNDPVKNIAENGLKLEYPNIDSVINLGKKIGRNEANIEWGIWLGEQRKKGSEIADNFLNGDRSFDRMKAAYSKTISLLTSPNPFDSLSRVK